MAVIELDSVERAIADIAAGKAVVVVDDEDRENEGDLIIAASALSTQKMAWMIKHSRCVLVLTTHSLSLPTVPSPPNSGPAATSASRSPASASKSSPSR